MKKRNKNTKKTKKNKQDSSTVYEFQIEHPKLVLLIFGSGLLLSIIIFYIFIFVLPYKLV